MLQKTKFLFLLIVTVVAFMGFYQISSNNDVFIKSTAMCCEQGMCHDNDCNLPSTMGLYSPTCQVYTLHCYDCMNAIGNNYVCGYEGLFPTWCNSNGERIYAKDPQPD